MNDTITAHKYRLSELESMMNYDNPGDSDLYPPRDDYENQNYSYDNGWDDAPIHDTNSGFNLPPHTSSSLMNVSPDASFSALDPSSKFLMLLIHKRIFLPNLVRLWKNWTPSLFQNPPLLMIEHQLISGVSQGFHPPDSAIPNNNSPNNPSSPSFSSPLINFGQININGLCSPC
ncbi:hypothetical protein GLOIN_2v1770668 [Rhizophagus irregularis DAOM 181602=DAOM 197198]|nr:hypothetical protein GLOIN_2v1770668 [Rhizophagus irregularis DAOM 181602=DAOM 197198]